MKTTTLKTKAMSILLIAIMLLGMLPMSVFAADTSNAITIVGANMTADEMQTAVAEALTSGKRDFTITSNLTEAQQKAAGTAFRDWCYQNKSDGTFHNEGGKGTVTLSLPDVTEVFSNTFGIVGEQSPYALGKIILPNVTRIGENAFENSECLKYVEAPKLTIIESRGFYACYSLKTVIMPNVEKVGAYAFRGCDLDVFSWHNITEIGDGAFSKCGGLKGDIVLPNITYIGERTFELCKNINSVAAPKVTTVGSSAFAYCPNLTSLTFGAAVKFWGGQALHNGNQPLYSQNITLTLVPDQKVLSGGDNANFNSEWTVADGAPTVEFGENKTFCGYTFKEIKEYSVPDLIITGGTEGTDYTYANGVLEIKKAGTYEIKNNDPTTATSDTIKVSATSGNVNITLAGVNIVAAEDASRPAFEITGTATTTFILKDGTRNIFDSWNAKSNNSRNYAGIQNGENPLVINCENSDEAHHSCNSTCGLLEAIGGNYAACIGGGYDQNGANIKINGGIIDATCGTNSGATGIGGGSGGNGSNITISGGIITAKGFGAYAGIGGGLRGNGTNIVITGGTVTATSSQGAGIGGGGFGDKGSDITISGGTVTATSGEGAGIGGGKESKGSNITISGGTVTATGNNGDGIGGGENGSAENIKISPAANTQIYTYNGSDNTGTALEGSPFARETDITSLLSGNAFFSYTDEHVHNYTYAASGAVITESCTCNHKETATIVKPDNLVYDGAAKEATVTYSDNWKGGELTITYSANGNIKAGDVTASIEKDGAKATVDFTIEKIVITVTINNASAKQYDALPEFTYTVSGLLPTDEWITKPVVSTQADMQSAGTFEITASGGDAGTNYTITYVPGTLTVENHTEHIGGTATCTEQAICTLCSQPYGKLAEHSYGTEWKTDADKHWHECSCGAKSGETAHGGGTATCTEKAKCNACGAEYGNLAEHTYGTEWKSDGTNHWHECSCGTKAAEATHTGGTATCAEKAICAACDAAYGNLADHTYKDGKCTVCQAADPNYVPETESPQTGDSSHLALWIALLFISGGAVITLTVVDRKKRAVK